MRSMIGGSAITYHQQNRKQFLGLGLRDASQTFQPVFPENSGRAAFHKRDCGQFEQIGFGSGFETVAHVLEGAFEHPPTHAITEMDHARGEAFAGLGERLDESSRNLEFASHSMDRNLVTKVPELKGRIKTAIGSGNVHLVRVPFRKWLSAVGPVCRQQTAKEPQPSFLTCG